MTAPLGATQEGGHLYTFGEADGGKLGLGENNSEVDTPTKVDIAEEVRIFLLFQTFRFIFFF